MTPRFLDHRTPGDHWASPKALHFATDTESVRRFMAALRRWHLTPDVSRAAGRDTGSPEADDPSRGATFVIDLVTVSNTVKRALAIRIALPERVWVDTTTSKLRGHLELLLREDLGDIDTPKAQALHKEAYQLLDRNKQPDKDTPPLHAYEHMRALALVTRAVAAQYQLHQTEKTRELKALRREKPADEPET
jgi:hypothetical protein